MGLYTNNQLLSEERDIEMNFNMDELQEAFFYDEHYSDSDDEKRELLEQADVLLESKKISRKTIVKLNKNDDLTRRTHLAALQKAKEMGDADWEALRKNRIKERQLLDRIYKKYANKVKRDAIKSQKRLIKLSPKAFDMNTRNLR